MRHIYHYTSRYKQVAQNEAADLLFNMDSLSKWISNHLDADPELINLFNEKIEKQKELYDILEKIIKH